MKHIATLALLSVALVGCASVSEGRYKTMQTALNGPAETRNAALKKCVDREKKRSLTHKQNVAMITGASVEAYPEVFCRRVMNGIASGRISYQDYLQLRNPAADNSKIVKIVQGR
ncbi:hypothetical protein [Oryzicola mucosus]|uniref:Lipoprotein n=1 Tax=Oryzicola mucosus TaxID=2767425 RepID=A0A8J6PQS4_9HYPH|nr:hypothetical protein [Oryzicola mucosus]MBD0416445.1 hypothetical protein [Oryzicola mucosus]